MKKEQGRNIGVDVKAPKGTCVDRHCPFHGSLSLHGRMFTGKVISTDFNKTAKIEWERSQYISKYERYQVKRTRIKVHNPDCIAAKIGDMVTVMECRPISKTKNFVIIQKGEQ